MSEVLSRPCKRCGLPVELDLSEMDEEDRKLAKAVKTWAHPQGSCPGELTPKTHTYRVEVIVYRDGEVDAIADPDDAIAKVASPWIESTSFVEALPEVTEGLNAAWIRLSEMAPMVDDE